MTPTARVLLATEGDAEVSVGSFSGTAYSILQNLRHMGYQVATADADLYGPARYGVAALTFRPNRDRWRARFGFATPAFAARSMAARLSARRAGPADLVLQIGATFAPPRPHLPYALFCDSNITVARRYKDFAAAPAMRLTERETTLATAREARIYRGASTIFTISEALRRSFVSDFGIDAERVQCTYSGPNFDVTATPPFVDRSGRAGPPTILFVGRDFARKGGHVLLAAFRQLRASHPDARLVIVGPTRLECSDAGVEVLGLLSKSVPAEERRLRAAFAEADVFVLPSLFEPYGVSIVEAMFFGLPCIVSEVWALPEVVANGETGFTVPVGDVDALAHGLRTLVADRELRLRMGAAARARAERLFTWERVTARIDAGLRALLDARGVHTPVRVGVVTHGV